MVGGVSIAGVAEFSGGMDARGTRVKNARLENATFEGVVGGDVVELAGGVRVGALKNAGGGGMVMVAAAESGELKVAAGLSFDDEKGVFMPGKVSGHEVSDTKRDISRPVCGGPLFSWTTVCFIEKEK